MCPQQPWYNKITMLVPKFRGVHIVPRGQPIFVDKSRWEYYKQYYEYHESRYDQKILENEARKKEQGKNIQTPLPNENHKYCQPCDVKYRDYREHIMSKMHNDSIRGDHIYTMVDEVIAELEAKREMEKCSKRSTR